MTPSTDWNAALFAAAQAGDLAQASDALGRGGQRQRGERPPRDAAVGSVRPGTFGDGAPLRSTGVR